MDAERTHNAIIRPLRHYGTGCYSLTLVPSCGSYTETREMLSFREAVALARGNAKVDRIYARPAFGSRRFGWHRISLANASGYTPGEAERMLEVDIEAHERERMVGVAAGAI